ncbi:hypothetical protein [Streptomyces sp. VNUA24]|uniref:hypothetical protein n=1 Tax=Streptomyces sp. VNUA24 TaxID=3031131 RepID=UPI0023B87B20|nr:hypothetical protein [Streptomyces sp. VNUA24]WEH17027.1 hypothetical protein PYR72_26360 [Streptomyces sp. VNUA24]
MTDTAVGRPERRPPVVRHVSSTFSYAVSCTASCAVSCAVTTLVIIPPAGGRLYTG